MRNAWIILKRELAAYFASPVAYAVGAMFLLLAGVFFALPFFFGSREATLRSWMNTVTVLLLFIAPMLTMKLLAEEKQSGTIELLLTSPLRDWEMVTGKFLAALTYWLALLVVTLIYPFILQIFGNPDWIPIATGYLALLLVGGAMLAIGVLSSAISPNQITAVMVAFAILLVFYIAANFQNVFRGTVGDVVAYLSLTTHMDDLMKGVIDSSHLLYYLSVIVGSLFISTRVIETRRWS
jgi:ABC-2 type transport system permease protein